jgi:ATP-dependent helicase/nuclease subunit B
MRPDSPRVFTIPASAPFLRTMIAALLDGRLIEGFPKSRDPLELARATLYVSTRRAARLARDAFVEATGGAAILPRIVSVGDIDEDEIVFAHAATGGIAAEALQCPDALDGMARKILLAEMIGEWAVRPEARTEQGVPLVASNPASILALADDLARLFDDMTTREVSWDKLKELVPDDLDVYWQQTLKFLDHARAEWPKRLAERAAIDPMKRRDLLIAAETKRLKEHPQGPVIAAGSTGSIPSTAALIATIAHLPHGAVVLPGLDTDLDAPSWDRIGGDDDETSSVHGHPQFALHGLLQRIGIAREAVEILGAAEHHGRERLVSEALRPADATDKWKERLDESGFIAKAESAMANLSVMAAANAEDEALGIAIALREAIDDGSKESHSRRAALITPDRALARRVLAALARWNVAVDDSGGDALADTSAGIFARLAAEVALGSFEPVPLLALLKHPLLRLHGHPSGHLPAIETLERAVLRGPRPRPGSAGLAQALRELRQQKDNLHPADPRRTLSDEELGKAEALVASLSEALAPLETLPPQAIPFAAIAGLHEQVIGNLSKDWAGKSIPFSEKDRDAKKLLEIFSEIDNAECPDALKLKPADYQEAFEAIIAGQIVRWPAKPESRVRILGPLEARLQQADRVVLGGLVEGIWPPDPKTDPWLSRPMRRKLGLDLPERRIGLSAHDFAQALGAKEVVLSYSSKREGAPTVLSRFVQRLAAVAGSTRWQQAQDRGAHYLAWGRSLDDPASPAKPCPRPQPKPPREVRPTSLSVTEIEHWLRDPYTIYAKHILKLRALDAIDTAPGASDRGTFIHDAIGKFSQKFATSLPDDPLKELLACGREAFAAVEAYPDARAFWWPRFERIARWFVDWEVGRHSSASVIFSEIQGAHEFDVGGRTFRLRVRADRIERLKEGRYAVLDFKTGTPPTDKQVMSGLAPQLTLETAILRAGGFRGIEAGLSVAEVAYVRLNGGEPAGQHLPKEFDKSSPDQEADKALASLTEVARKFEDPQTAYLSFTRPQWIGRTYSDYDHLARVKEWSATGGEAEFELE